MCPTLSLPNQGVWKIINECTFITMILMKKATYVSYSPCFTDGARVRFTKIQLYFDKRSEEPEPRSIPMPRSIVTWPQGLSETTRDSWRRDFINGAVSHLGFEPLFVIKQMGSEHECEVPGDSVWKRVGNEFLFYTIHIELHLKQDVTCNIPHTHQCNTCGDSRCVISHPSYFHHIACFGQIHESACKWINGGTGVRGRAKYWSNTFSISRWLPKEPEAIVGSIFSVSLLCQLSVWSK